MTTAPETITVPVKLLVEAHAVMLACGWQLATAAEHQSEGGVIEAAATEIEAAFAELLAGETLAADDQ